MAIFAQRLLAGQAFGHRFIEVNDHRKQTSLGLQPDLVKVFLQRATHA